MRLVFLRRHDFGRDRYYPMNTLSRALVDLTNRKCLKDVELARLRIAGFDVAVQDLNNDTAAQSTDQTGEQS